MHADCRHFPAIHPNAGAAWNLSSRNTKIRERTDDRPLDGANIGAHIALPFSQIQDRITDDLSGAVIRDVAAAVGGVKLNASAGKSGFAREQVFGMAVAPLRDDVGMFDE